MTFLEIIKICEKGRTAMIPGWKGYIDYDYVTNLIYFHNGDYRMNQDELFEKVGKREDLLYII